MNHSKFIISGIFLLLSTFVFSQHDCGFHVGPQEQQYMQRHEKLIKSFDFNTHMKSAPDFYPVQAHVVRRSNGTGGLTQADINGIISVMNGYFINANMQFFQCDSVNFIDDDNYFDFDAADENAIGSANDVANKINIYFFNSVSSGSSALCGYAYFPGGPDRIVMNNSCALNGSTMTHEMGHYFALWHTHGKSNSTLTDELVNGSNCSTAGDEICDTPADPQLSFSNVNSSCVYTGTTVDTNGDAFAPDPSNIMSYSRKACRNLLSSGQYSRMAAIAATNRSYLNCASTPGYCVSNSTSNLDTEVEEVIFNTISNNSANTCASYTDNTGISTTVTKGQSYTLTVTTGDCDGAPTYQRTFAAYIDWNRDYDFDDAGERLFIEPAGTNQAFSRTVTVNVPANASIGNTVLRIVANEDTIAPACGTYSYGETEDYTVTIENPFCINTITSFPYNEDFELETDLGALGCPAGYTMASTGWFNNSLHDIDWNPGAGGTSSSNTGPSIDNNPGTTSGIYMYTEASVTCSPGGSPSKEAILESPCFDLSSLSNPAITFYYHMYGSDMGSLELQASTPSGSWISLWSTSGNKGDVWNQQVVSLSPYVGQNVKLRFRAVTGSSFESDIAIDDISVQEFTGSITCNTTISSFPYTADFEGENSVGNQSCPSVYNMLSTGWTNSGSDDIDWNPDEGGTSSSGTGPSIDYNPGTSSGIYLYLEGSIGCSPGGNPGKTAILESPCFDLSGLSDPEFSFAYHMYGPEMGSLSVELDSGNGIFNQIWTLNGNQGNSWNTHSVSLLPYINKTIKIRFVGTTGVDWGTDMAIDDVQITDNVSLVNDNCTGAITINSCDTSFTGSTVQASTESIGISTCGTSISAPGVWYKYTGTGDTTIVSTCNLGTNYDTKLSVFAGTCGNLTCLTGDDDDPNCSQGLSSTVEWLSQAGQDYYILVHGYSSNTGNFELSISTSSWNAISGSTSLCQGQSVSLSSAMSFNNYQWYKDGNPIVGANGQSHTTGQAGSYTLQYGNSTSCLSMTNAKSVSVNNLPTVSFGNLSNICENDNPITLSGGTPSGGTYSGPGVSGGQFDPSAVGVGSYTITYAFTDGNGCSNSATSQITVNSTPSASVSNMSDVCSDDGAFSLNSGSPSGGTYSGPGVSGGQFDPAVAGAGTHTIVYTVTVGGCSALDSNTITVNSSPSVSLSPFSSICEGSSAITLSGGSPGGGSYTGNGVSGNTFDPLVSGVGSHTITYSYTDASSGCSSSDSESITVHPKPTVTLLSQGSICNDAGPVALSGGSPVGGSYIGQYVSSGNFNPTGLNQGNYTVGYVYTDGNNCTDTAFNSISVTICTNLDTDLSQENEILVYPNPANHVLFIQMPEQLLGSASTFTLYDVSGRLIYSQKFTLSSSDVEINTKDISAGNYILEINGPDLLEIEQVVILK